MIDKLQLLKQEYNDITRIINEAYNIQGLIINDIIKEVTKDCNTYESTKVVKDIIIENNKSVL